MCGVLPMQEKKIGIAHNLGGRLRQWRKSSNYKIAELADLISISQGSLSDLENNKSLPSADTIAKLYRHTDLDIIWLLINKGTMRKRKYPGGGDHSYVYEDDQTQQTKELNIQDQHLKELVDTLIRIYHNGDPEKVAHLKGFLMGADPGD